MLSNQLEAYKSPSSLLDGDSLGLDLNAVETAAPGYPALLPNGVLYHADWHKPEDGIHRHAREAMLALALVGVPLRTHQVSASHQQNLHQEVEDAVGWMRNVSLASSFASIRHTCAARLRAMMELCHFCASPVGIQGSSRVLVGRAIDAHSPDRQ